MNRPAGRTTEVTRALWFRISPRPMFFVCRQVFQCFTLVGVCMCMSAWINERMTEWLFFFRLKTNILIKKNWGMEHEYEQFFGDHFFQIRGPLSQERTWGFQFRWHLWGPQALDNSSIEKENNFFGRFYFQIRGPLSQERTRGFRFRWHLWGPQALDNFSLEKEN